MSVRICYLDREDRGGRLKGVRVVGPRFDSAWEAPPGDAADDLSGAVYHSAAAWITQELSARTGPKSVAKRLDLLCLDADGSACTWVSAPSPDRKSVAAVAARQAEAGGFDGDGFTDEDGGGDTATRFPDLPGEISYEPLAPASAAVGLASAAMAETGTKPSRSILPMKKPASRGRNAASATNGSATEHAAGRSAVLAMSEVPARALLDELDRLGVSVGASVTIWHAAAAAWDPAAGSAALSRGMARDPLDASTDSVSATVLADPDGRLVWTWSVTGAVVAAGSMRLPRDGRGSPVLTDRCVARLGLEWVSWTAQIGVVPDRVRFITANSMTRRGWGGGDAESGVLNGSTVGPPLDDAGLGAALRRAVPNAVVDLAHDDDPIGLTLARAAELLEDGRVPAPTAASSQAGGGVLAALTNRPGRRHRAMYTWVAAAFAMASVAIGVWAFQVLQTVGGVEDEASRYKNEIRALREQFALPPVNPMAALRSRIERAKRSLEDDPTLPAPLPILDELYNLSFVLQNEAYQLEDLDLGTFAVTVRVVVPSLSDAQLLEEAVRFIPETTVAWQVPNLTPLRDGGIRVQFIGDWRDQDPGESG